MYIKIGKCIKKKKNINIYKLFESKQCCLLLGTAYKKYFLLVFI